MPLSYVVWDQVAPERTKDSQGNFIAKTIACAPLIITHFQSDTRKVHQFLNNYLVTETAEQWIRGTKKRVNGRDDFYDLLRHYSGEGNVRCRVATVDHLRETLHYKSDRALSFNMFLDRMQKIINIFRNGEEIMADSTQVRELFRRFQHPQLQGTVKSLELRADLDGITYSEGLIISNPPYPRYHSTSFPKRFPEFSPVKSTMGVIKMAVATRVKVDSTLA